MTSIFCKSCLLSHNISLVSLCLPIGIFATESFSLLRKELSLREPPPLLKTIFTASSPPLPGCSSEARQGDFKRDLLKLLRICPFHPSPSLRHSICQLIFFAPPLATTTFFSNAQNNNSLNPGSRLHYNLQQHHSSY